jgi:hypothetical protein
MIDMESGKDAKVERRATHDTTLAERYMLK